MTKKEAVKVLRQYNDWRRYTGPIGTGPEMQSAYIIGEAIDVAIEVLESVDSVLIGDKDFAKFNAEVGAQKEMVINYQRLIEYMNRLPVGKKLTMILVEEEDGV